MCIIYMPHGHWMVVAKLRSLTVEEEIKYKTLSWILLFPNTKQLGPLAYPQQRFNLVTVLYYTVVNKL